MRSLSAALLLVGILSLSSPGDGFERSVSVAQPAPPQARPPRTLATLIEEYRLGDTTAAIDEFATWDAKRVEAEVTAWETRRANASSPEARDAGVRLQAALGMLRTGAAGQTVVGMLRPGDSVSLVTFSSRLSLEADAVRDPGVLREALVGARPSGRTAVWDALFAGMSLVAGRAQRSLVLLLTDGIDNSSWMTCEQVAEALGRADVVVYAVQPRLGLDVAGRWLRRTDLLSVANAAGGDVFEAESSDRLPQQFSAIFKEFRARYLLVYEPTGVGRDDGWHRLEVRVRRQHAKVVTRPGYFASGR